MDSDGANHRFITTGQAMALTPRFSPDYKKIVYLSYLNGRRASMSMTWSLQPASGRRNAQSHLCAALVARWQVDPLFDGMAGNTNIYRVSAQGGASQLTDTPGINVGGSYSPDGSKIVFESDRSGSQQIYVMNADGSNQHRISFFGGQAPRPNGARAATRSPSPALRAICHCGDRSAGRLSPSDPQLAGRVADLGAQWPHHPVLPHRKGTGRSSLWQVDLTGRHERAVCQRPWTGPTPVGGRSASKRRGSPEYKSYLEFSRGISLLAPFTQRSPCSPSCKAFAAAFCPARWP
jgi:TolB protein